MSVPTWMKNVQWQPDPTDHHSERDTNNTSNRRTVFKMRSPVALVLSALVTVLLGIALYWIFVPELSRDQAKMLTIAKMAYAGKRRNPERALFNTPVHHADGTWTVVVVPVQAPPESYMTIKIDKDGRVINYSGHLRDELQLPMGK